jgi:hypothetical protein
MGEYFGLKVRNYGTKYEKHPDESYKATAVLMS